MKWLSKIFSVILAVGENRYVHSTIGALIAAVMLCAFCWLPAWATLLISFLVSSTAIIIKDCVMDGHADVLDIAFGYAGAFVVWVSYIVGIFV